jgi:hypothetical protein
MLQFLVVGFELLTAVAMIAHFWDLAQNMKM